MNYGPLLFLAAFFALASSWFGFVLTPQLQIGHLQQANAIPSGATYPLARPGLARQGLDVYRANGCAYCHSQQVGQKATVCDVVLAETGTNKTKLISALLATGLATSETEAGDLIAKVPLTVRRGVKKEIADADIGALKSAGAKPELWILPVGPDIARGWGQRRTVAEDFLFDSPVMLGSQRIGPDLANVGSRLADPNWQLRHLYSPRAEVKESTMPPYRFLFEKRKIERTPSAEALKGVTTEPGYEVVPTEDATALVAYLVSLRADAPLFVAPITVPAAVPSTTETNAAATGSTNSASLTNENRQPVPTSATGDKSSPK